MMNDATCRIRLFFMNNVVAYHLVKRMIQDKNSNLSFEHLVLRLIMNRYDPKDAIQRTMDLEPKNYTLERLRDAWLDDTADLRRDFHSVYRITEINFPELIRDFQKSFTT
jgi:hypothetical protein